MEKRIQQLIESDLNSLGYNIVQIIFSGEDKRKKLEIFIERKDDQRLQIADCKKASNLISALLDVEDFIKDKYYLEVSSAGLERPLVRFEDYQKFVGREVKIRLKNPLNNNFNFKGKIKAAEGGKIALQSKNVELVFDYDNIKRANLVLTDEMFKDLLKLKKHTEK